MIDSTLLEVRQHNECKLKPGLELEDFRIHRDDDDQIVRIGVDLDPSNKAQLKNLMEQYKDIFTWLPVDMPRIDISMVCHKLSIDQSVKTVQQNKRNHGAECQKAIKEEVTKLL